MKYRGGWVVAVITSNGEELATDATYSKKGAKAAAQAMRDRSDRTHIATPAPRFFAREHARRKRRGDV